MKSKVLSIFLASIFIISFVSAVEPVLSSTTPSPIVSKSSTTTFTISVTNNVSVNFNFPSSVQITDNNDKKATLSIINETSITDVKTARFKISVLNIEDGFSFIQQTKNIEIEAVEVASPNNTKKINVSVSFTNTFCSVGNVGDLRVRLHINNNGHGKDDEWYLLDEIELEVKVDNRDDEKIRDIIVEWMLINKNTGKIIDENDEEEFDLSDGKNKILTIKIKLDPDDFSEDDLGDNLMLIVKAFSDDVGENVQCAYETKEAELIDEDFIILDFNKLSLPETLQCGSSVDVTAATFWNIGSDNQDDVELKVSVNEFGFQKIIELGDIDSLDDKRTSFLLEIPKNIREGTYNLRFEVYDEDGNYFEDADEKESIFTIPLTIKGNCQGSTTTTSQSSVGISARLESGAVAGQNLIIKTTITNTGTEQTLYQISALNYDTWASLNSIEPRTITLDAGSSREVVISLTPNSDVSGNNDFTLQVSHNGRVTEKKISVPNIQPKVGWSGIKGLTGSSIANNIRENWIIWLIAIINVVLIILIIIVAIRIAKR
ncbi:MAG: putative S-layer protein [Candidatus Pacearchaeota archaeon]